MKTYFIKFWIIFTFQLTTNKHQQSFKAKEVKDEITTSIKYQKKKLV